jgi:hypothetical protein
MNQTKEYLFGELELADFLRQREEQMYQEIDQFRSDYVLKINLDEVVASLTDRFQLNQVTLHTDKIFIGDNGDAKLDVSGNLQYRAFDTSKPLYIAATLVEFVVPFVGDPMLLLMRPNQFSTSFPRARISGQEIRFRCVRADHDGKAIRASFDQELKNVTQYVSWSAQQLESYNNNLPQRIRQRLDSRKEKFLKDKGMVEALGFPIKPRANAPVPYSVPVTRKKLPVVAPSVPGKPAISDPHLDMAAYESILQTIGSMARVLELSPKAFAKMDEEALRFTLLVPLNVHYEGQATGETFNYEGKTDILIKVGGRNIFIGECLVWDGPVYLEKKINQLLGYTSWRDTKTAIIIFNRNKNLTAVLKEIPSVVEKHPSFIQRIASYKNETGFRFVLRHRDDNSRELTVTVLVFDVPV